MDIDARKHPPRLDWSEARSTVTIERETLKRAAQALAYCYSAIENMSDDEDDMISRSNAALRAALAAQPAPVDDHLKCGHHRSLAINSAETGEFLYCDLCDAKSRCRDAETMEEELRAALAAQPAEPVAHEFQDRNGKWCPFIDDQHYRNTVKDGSWPIRALYAAPAAVPLTDEQIGALWDDHVVPVFGKNGINPIVFARAVLAAAGEKT